MIKFGKQYPLWESRQKITYAVGNANKIIEKDLKPRNWKRLQKTQIDAQAGKDTYNLYSRNGIFTKSREKLHKKIIAQHFADKKTIDKRDPDLYLLGGPAGSGKTTYLQKQFVREPTVHIDADAIKWQLAKKNKSPIPGKKLAHAQLLHEESKHISEEEIQKSIREKRDTTLDVTMASKEKTQHLIDRYKKAGFDVHVFGTQLSASDAISRATKRFLESAQGRFVPPKLIGASANQINANVMYFANKKVADSFVVLDTTTRDVKTIKKYRARLN